MQWRHYGTVATIENLQNDLKLQMYPKQDQ